jgi:hypothetical protein
MSRTRTVKIDLVERTFRAEIEFRYFRGHSGTYYEPPEPQHVEIDSVTLLGDDDKPLPCPDWLEELIVATDYVNEELIDYAQEDF